MTNDEDLVSEETIDEAATSEPEAAAGGGNEAGGSDGEAGDGEAETSPDGEAPDLKTELEELEDRHLRLAAEFNNFRRRSEQERLGAWARAQAELVGKFLDVLDDLSRVAELDLTNATVEAIMEGVDLVERKFVRTLEDSGVEVIDPLGEAFDPERMEAMMRVPAESEEQDDSVAQVLQKGYSLKGTLVRPARVAVYKNG
ncbi:MAG TPA: nucleotide exchange factor GrpE [Longimicrobiales bacterium]|nr:nucleotide exchange factor GrpE [Longimicrobiales bacterium]